MATVSIAGGVMWHNSSFRTEQTTTDKEEVQEKSVETEKRKKAKEKVRDEEEDKKQTEADAAAQKSIGTTSEAATTPQQPTSPSSPPNEEPNEPQLEKCGLPDWLPAVGELTDISLNTMRNVAGTELAAATKQQIDAWAGAAYAKDYGECGSLIFHTGGHTYFDSNAVYSYDITTRLFTQERPPAAQFLDAEKYIGDTVTGWMWSQTGGGEVQVGEPFASHTYSWLTWLPADVLPGSATGYLYTPGRSSMSQPGQKGTNQPHKYALGSGQLWTFAGAVLPQRPSHSFAFFDESRRRVVYGFGDATARILYWVDPVTSATGTITWPVGDVSFAPYYHTGFHDVADDLYLTVRLGSAGLAFNVIDPVAGRRYQPATSGTAPVGPFPLGDAGVEWVEDWRSLVFYAGTDTVWILTAPADPRTGTWQWSSRSLAGTSRHLTTPSYTKFRYIEPLDLFVWPMTHDTPVQGFRVSPP